MEFQIRFVERNGCASFLYFESTAENKEVDACLAANGYLRKQKDRDVALANSFFHSPYKPLRSIKVVEYDNVNHTAKRGGVKFKLTLCYTSFKFQDGTKITNNWYELD